LRSATALAGGLLREIGDVALPGFVRRTHLYKTLVDSTLRFLIEQVGQVEGAYPPEEQLAENFLLRRTAGNGIELIGILAFRASPVWVMAALADVSGAGRQLIREIAATLKEQGLIAADMEVNTVEQMLEGLERTAGRVAEAVNTPPLDVDTLRKEWIEIRHEVASIPSPNLPSAADVWQSWHDLNAEAARQNRTVWELSSLMALSAVTRLPENLRWLGKSAALATRRTGAVFAGALLNHYREALSTIRNTGYLRYCVREFRPYLRAAALQFSPRRISLTQRILQRNTVLILFCLLAQASAQQKTTQARMPVLQNALRAHVSFLASDAMQGRDTPSHELDIAAEYIASQFRRLGLKSDFQVSEQTLLMESGGSTLSIPTDKVTGALSMPFHVRLWKVRSLQNLTNKAVITTPEVAREIVTRRSELKPLMVVAVAQAGSPAVDGAITVFDPAVQAAYEKLPEDRAEARLLFIPAGLKNVMGVLPGSDPILRHQYVIVSAHYDHVGTRSGNFADRIYNGANDNASGVAGVIESAAFLATSPVKPRRTILFLTYFGEEKGLLGAHYYAQHPMFPIENTVAQINLEQLGRTDDSEGPRVGAAVVTGFDFSEVGAILKSVGARVGVKVQNPPKSDEFFNRSDNEGLALAGVPAHTLGIAFMFPDYHQPGDEWQKIDYNNMAKVTRLVAAGALAIANRREPPHWLKTNPKAERYFKNATRLSAPREVSAQGSGNSPASPKPQRSTLSRQ
jgi:hypothetical protein